MTDFEIPYVVARAGLGAIKSVALADGTFAARERALLEAAARAIGHPADPDALEPMGPDEVAGVVIDPMHRERLIQALVVASVIDEEPSRAEVALVERFAVALGVDEPRVRDLSNLQKGRIGVVRFDQMRRAPILKKFVKDAWTEAGMRGVYRLVKAIATGEGPQDRELAFRYKKLGLLPEGTLGRAFWAHMTANEFAFPGEPGGLMENGGLQHDALHVMTGYDTDAEGETQIAAFSAACWGEDPFAFVFMVLLMFHLGVKLSPIATPARGTFDPEKIRRAIVRGARCDRRVFDRWDFFELAPLPIAEARAQFGIPEA
jgi:hypothetical protein